MGTPRPMTLLLPFHMVDTGTSVLMLLSDRPGVSAGEAYRLQPAFSLSSREEDFARTLLRNKRNLWLFRCHQQGFCGDFLVVDMSEPQPERRSVAVIELKARAALKLGAGGLQVRNAPIAIQELVAQGILTPSSPVEVVTGDKAVVLGWLGWHPV